MLKITIPGNELYDELTGTFIQIKSQTIQLEHSLVSISKWEAKWRKPFLSKETKTIEEFTDYVRCMTLTQNVDPNVYKVLTPKLLEEIYEYIGASMTATTFSRHDNRPPNREVITSEIIYYWMVSYNIPVEFQKWHLSRLLTLINVCNLKNAPTNKMTRKEQMAQNRALNRARRKRLNSRG